MDMKAKVGGIPKWGWIVIVPVTIVAVLYWRYRKSTKAAAAAANDPYNPLLNGTPRDVSLDPGVGTGGFFDHVPPSPVGVDDIVSNEQWAIHAINDLISKGYPASDADAAIRAYISTQPVSASQRSLVDIALGVFGAPPNLLPPAAGGGASLLGYAKKTYSSAGPLGASFLGDPSGDQAGSTDPAIYAYYSDNTYRWISGEEWQKIVINNGGIAPAVDLIEAASDLWNEWRFQGLRPPSWISPTGVTPYSYLPPKQTDFAAPSSVPTGYHVYTVGSPFKAGGSLFGLAQIIYGDGNKWPLLYNLNRSTIRDPNVLYEGQKLIVPNTGALGAGIQGPYQTSNEVAGYDVAADWQNRNDSP